MLSRQTRVEILLNAPGLEEKRARPVRGRWSVQEALEIMCRGMNVVVQRVNADLYLVTAARRSAQKPSVRPALPDQPDILVTARRKPEREQDVPLVVTRTAADGLERANVRTLSDLSRIMPGFVATEQTASATPLLVMRGQRRSIGDENRLPLVVYQDEVPLPNQAALSPLYDVRSVEILRGPQGTLFGRNTTGGAVLILTARPGDGVPSYIETDIGNYGLHRLEGAAELPRQGAFALRIAGQRLRREGFSYLASGGRADDAHSDALRATLRYAPEGLLRSTLSFDMLNADEKGAALILSGIYEGGVARTAANAPWYDCGGGTCDIDSYAVDPGRRTSQAGLAPIFQRRFRGLSNITEYGDDKLLVRNIMGWRSTRLLSSVDGDGTPLQINDGVTRSDLRQWTEELQVQGRLGSLRYIGGAFYLDSAPAGAMLQDIARFVRPDNPAYHVATYQRFRSAAVFGQITSPLGRDFTLDLGLRYTHEWIGGCSLSSASAQPRSEAECRSEGGAQARSTSGRLTWTLALSKTLGNQNLYLTSRRAFRSGGYNSPVLGGTLTPFQTFRPEGLTDLELGLKGHWRTGTLSGSYTLAAYAGVYTNIQRAVFPEPNFDGDNDPATDPATLYVNSARARVSGLDGEMLLNAGSHTHVRLNASWIDARYTAIDAPAVLRALLGSDPINNRFAYTPRLRAAAALTHEIALPGRLGRVDLDADYSLVSTIHFTERAHDALGRQPGYGLLGASISWRKVGGRPLDIQLWARNLTDRFYATGGGTINPAFTAATIIPGPPRTFGLRIHYSFE